jgi:hypothetical protein
MVAKIMEQPSKSDWAVLYQAAITFKETAPWEWMDNESLFAIENPDDREIGYCSVLGAGGEEFGLGMFVGEKGYERYRNLISEEVAPDDLEENTMTRSLTMLLVDRDVLQEEDHKIIRSLGLRFRGRNAWPFFRSQRPGYVPWFLDKSEARFLTAALHQALGVANEVHSGKLELCAPEPEDLVFTRCYRGDRWLGQWREAPAPIRRRGARAKSIDAVREAELHLLSSRASKVSDTWELDIFMLPMPIGSESERPYFPSCFLLVERKLGLVLGTNLTKPWLTTAEKQDEILQILTKVNQIPSEIRVRSNKVKQIAEPVTSILGIKLRVGPLPVLEQVKASLRNYLSKRYA